LGGFLQYHAHHPRDKRLVQTGVIGNAPDSAAAEIKNSVAVFQFSKNKGLRASEIKVKMMA
jgi:hypothetical protein